MRDTRKPQAILAQRLFDGDEMRGPTLVEIAGGRIAAVRSAKGARNGDVLALPADAILAPGFIDIQVNGGGGIRLNDDPSAATVRRIAAAHRHHGTTGLLPTLVTDAPDKLSALAGAAAEIVAVPGVLGLHVEGPFINPTRKGIHPAHHIRPLDEVELATLLRFAAHGRSVITLAPECMPQDAVRRLAQTGLRISIGHSDATAEQAVAAARAGATGVTHLYNAMPHLAGRAPGIVGATFASDVLMAGIIADGHHVDATALRAAYRALGKDRLMLVSDDMGLTGSDETAFDLQGRRITLSSGRLTDAAGTLAGAHLTMFDAVRNAIRLMDVDLVDALVMASRTPARFLGLEASYGRVAPGFCASLVAFTPEKVFATWVDGDYLAAARP